MCSISAMAFDTEDCEIESSSAAFPMLSVSATVIKMCRSCNLSRRPMRLFHIMGRHSNKRGGPQIDSYGGHYKTAIAKAGTEAGSIVLGTTAASKMPSISAGNSGAVLSAAGAGFLLFSYDVERRPIGTRNVRMTT